MIDFEEQYRKKDVVGWTIDKLKEFYPNDPIKKLYDLSDIIPFQELVIERGFSGKFSFLTDEDRQNWHQTLKTNKDKFNYKLYKIAEQKGIPMHLYASEYSSISEVLMNKLKTNDYHLYLLDGIKKTYTLCAILMKYAVEGHTCRYYEAQEAVRKLKENACDAEGLSLEDRLRDISYLFIDDLGDEDHRFNNQLNDLLCYRINYRKHTFIARSTVNKDKFEERYPILHHKVQKNKLELVILE